MTVAICFKCGEFKFGAFCPCDKCGQEPKTEDERIISMAMTDHYFDQATLQQISIVTKETGKPPDLNPESVEQFREVIRECEQMMPELERLVDEEVNRTSDKKPWWKFW